MFRRLLGKQERLKVNCEDLRVVCFFNYLLMKTDDCFITSGFKCELLKVLLNFQTFFSFAYRGVCVCVHLWNLGVLKI